MRRDLRTALLLNSAKLQENFQDARNAGRDDVAALIREAGVLLTQAIVALGKQERTAVTS